MITLPKNRTVGILGSAFIHIFVLSMFFLHPHRVLVKVEVHTAQNEDKEQKLKGEERIGQGLTCGGYHYDGVGILVGSDGRILDVGPNTPAESAGLKEGDYLVDFNQLFPNRYQVGTVLNVLVRRDGVVINIPIHIGRICSE